MPKLWHSRPIHTALIELLQKRPGSITDVELYKALKRDDGDLGFIAFNKTLMALEIKGMIHVYNVTKNRRGIELIKTNAQQ